MADDKALRELVVKVKNEQREKRQQSVSELEEKQREFANYIKNRYDRNAQRAELAGELREWLNKGNKPSDFFQLKCGDMFNGYILPRYKEAFLYSVDNVTRWQYSTSYWRRSFRSAKYAYYYDRIISMMSSFHRDLGIDKSYIDILKLNLPEDEKAYYKDTYHTNQNAAVIAYELDIHPDQMEPVVIDILNGEGELTITHSLIAGICMSSNANMHEYLGKLLLAARLQEGLRQSICEAADCGSVEAFLAILKVINENNLIRFSSVKRAVGTWTGLLNTETADIERISAKTVNLLTECLADETKRREYLYSEDSMQIYLALWSYGCIEAEAAVAKFIALAESGTHHQILTAGYFAANLDNPNLAHRTAQMVIEKHESLDILAVYMPYVMPSWHSGYGGAYLSNDELLKRYFYDKSDAEKFYERLKEIYAWIPKKTVEFSPCIFPWYTASISRGSVVMKMGLIAYALCSTDKADEVCPRIKDCKEYERSALLELLLKEPVTDTQYTALTDMLSDRAEYVRKKAFSIAKTTQFKEENYLQMEDMLRYKAADMRAGLIEILSNEKRTAEECFASVKSLLADKKEEKRTAGLDLAMRILDNEDNQQYYDVCRSLCAAIEKPTSKEKILIEKILGNADGEKNAREPLFTKEDAYIPNIEMGEFAKEALAVFMRYFPQSSIANELYPDKKSSASKSKNGTMDEAEADVISLDKFIEAHRDDEFVKSNGETAVLGSCQLVEFWANNQYRIPLDNLWSDWCEKELKGSPERIMRMLIRISSYKYLDVFSKPAKAYAERLYGKGYGLTYSEYEHNIIPKIIDMLKSKYVPWEDCRMLSAAAEIWFMKCVPDEDVMLKFDDSGMTYHKRPYVHLIGSAEIAPIMCGAYYRNSKYNMESFALDILVHTRCKNDKRRVTQGYYNSDILMDMRGKGGYAKRVTLPSASEYFVMAYQGKISERALYHYIFGGSTDTMAESFSVMTGAVPVYREQQIASGRDYYSSYRKINGVSQLLNKVFDSKKNVSEQLTKEDMELLAFVDKIYENAIKEVLSVELTRGDTPTAYSKSIRSIGRIYGLDNFISILMALGKDTLERTSWSSTETKKASLSHLLAVCIPNPDDDAAKLANAMKDTDITQKRLIEAAMYSPEWLDIVGAYLDWDGFKSSCWYFMAHMNERFDDKKQAIIAKYTPFTAEELNAGAFDLEWFEAAYKMLGEKRFNMIYDAAKYISDGTKHSRARKYADAALGKLKPKETAETIFDKRNKDLVMAYSLIPLDTENTEDDICERYLNLQRFLKESKKFGQQRAASEKRVVDIAMQNLATRAGYADVLRLTLRMEAKLIDDSRELFDDKEIDDVVVRLDISEPGKPKAVCTKAGKELKSIPARLKKNAYIILLNDTKKKLTEQYRRTKAMFEQAMEDQTVFTVSEITALLKNPVAEPVIKYLVFICKKKQGFIDGTNLLNYTGRKSKLAPEDAVVVAHPFDLYQGGHWVDFQRYLFDRQIVQPFKQVFRELYVKTDEESEMTHSLRYAGNQIQPAKTVACLKGRRWVADIEDGLQKVYYKENIVASIYAMADWFSPADIEAPTLEWVCFFDRNTGKELKIKDIPDIIFSEVMRDVDLAVSVAHAGGVDPETSHSTIEMRAALLEFTLPLFKLENVRIKDTHAHIKGELAEYTLHLGSGVVHKMGGAMIPILPVHSSHRGRLFLPFADDDPKTAEILSKALLLAEDKKIKDPKILMQINS